MGKNIDDQNLGWGGGGREHVPVASLLDPPLFILIYNAALSKPTLLSTTNFSESLTPEEILDTQQTDKLFHLSPHMNPVVVFQYDKPLNNEIVQFTLKCSSSVNTMMRIQKWR